MEELVSIVFWLLMFEGAILLFATNAFLLMWLIDFLERRKAADGRPH